MTEEAQVVEPTPLPASGLLAATHGDARLSYLGLDPEKVILRFGTFGRYQVGGAGRTLQLSIHRADADHRHDQRGLLHLRHGGDDHVADRGRDRV